MTVENGFKSWAIVAIMGHQTYAGFVSEQRIGGTAFVRVDVPEVNGQPAFSKLFGGGSIYSITPCSEEVARYKAVAVSHAPMTQWDLPEEIRNAIKRGRSLPPALPAPEDKFEHTQFPEADYDPDRDTGFPEVLR
jgi:hypothetical protein